MQHLKSDQLVIDIIFIIGQLKAKTNTFHEHTLCWDTTQQKPHPVLEGSGLTALCFESLADIICQGETLAFHIVKLS